MQTRKVPPRGGNKLAALEDNWTRKQRQFMEWLATPKAHRVPAFQKDFAEEIDRSPRTLRRWKNLPGFMDAVQALARNAGAGRYASVLNAMADEAEHEGNVAAARLFFEAIGALETPGTGDTTVTQAVAGFTIEEMTAARQKSEAFDDDIDT